MFLDELEAVLGAIRRKWARECRQIRASQPTGSQIDSLLGGLDLELALQELSGTLFEDEVGSDGAVWEGTRYILVNLHAVYRSLCINSLLRRGESSKLLDQLALRV